jgi:two-component system sensor histidine kinase QseC
MRSWLRPTLTRRVVLAVLGGFVLVWLVLVTRGFVLLYGQWQQDDRDFGATPLGLNLHAIFDAVEDPNQANTFATLLERVRTFNRQREHSPFINSMQILDRRDRSVVYASPEIAGELLRGDPHHKHIQVVRGRAYDVFEVDTSRWEIVWARSIPYTPWRRFFWILQAYSADGLLSSMALALPCVLLPVWLAVSYGLRPLKQFSERIRTRGTDDLSPVGINPRYAELMPLRASLDDLLARLRHKIENEKAFVANAAHELRTPLAVIAAQAHVLGNATTDRERHDAQHQMEATLERASHLIHQLLSLERMEMAQQERSVTDVAQLVRRELIQLVPAAVKRDMEVTFEAPDKLTLTLELHPLRSILQNLLDNAIRYGREGGKIGVDLWLEAGNLVITVADDGPGIETAARKRVFDRFQRGTGHEVSGSGLGLTIVQQAATRMGGTVTLTDGPNGRGCSFIVSIPSGSNPL